MRKLSLGLAAIALMAGPASAQPKTWGFVKNGTWWSDKFCGATLWTRWYSIFGC